jgi:hypothetical protein
MRIGKYRFFFYSNENDEPRHVHIQSAENQAKYWLEPIELSWNFGFNSKELKQIEQHLQNNLSYILETWNEYFHDTDEAE